MGKTSIEWTRADDGAPGKTWNPVTGCDEISPGCDHCYAKVFAERWRGVPGHAYEQGFDLKLWPARIDVPLTWKKPARIFVNSMSDLFHHDIPDAFILQVFATMRVASWHTFQVLTKRPKHAVRFFERNNVKALPDNVWMGTTIEHNDYTWRADALRQIPARVRFISAEPLLSALPSLDVSGIHWLICGGESGHGARHMEPTWAYDLRDRCQAAGVAYFFKQWGAYEPVEFADGSFAFHKVGKHAAGRLLDGREWNEFPA